MSRARDTRVTLPCSWEQKEDLVRRAKQKGLSVSNYLRLVLGWPFEQQGNRKDLVTKARKLSAISRKSVKRKGDQALFGKSTQAMKAHWKVPDNRPLADFAPTIIILKAKDFAAEITIFNARQHQMGNEAAISREHITNNEAVRKTLLERGIRPESLPPDEDVKKVERRLLSEDKKSLKNLDSLDS